MVVALAASGGPAVGEVPFVFSGLPATSPKLQISVDPAGYSDSMLDLRTKFSGREYLSGEWAGAIYYEGGHVPAMSRRGLAARGRFCRASAMFSSRPTRSRTSPA
ncbi:MAG: hypothetical protein Q7R22_007725 [Verrucomicrobiota bacterium JB025]|nr:hypothetical protein [Verrucomicrobiota bacterium JB025]